MFPIMLGQYSEIRPSDDAVAVYVEVGVPFGVAGIGTVGLRQNNKVFKADLEVTI